MIDDGHRIGPRGGSRGRGASLSFEGAYTAPHFDRTAFRTKHRIFATLPPGGESANLLLGPDEQAVVCEALPGAFAPVPGGWGRMGYTTVDLRAVREADLVRALTEAHAKASVARKTTSRKTTSRKKTVPATRKTKKR